MFWICSGKASVPGSRRFESILVYYEKKTRCNKAPCSSARFYHRKKKRRGKKKMIYCFWPHPWSAENIVSKVASAFLHLTETNPQEGLGGPPPAVCRLYALLACVGFPWGSSLPSRFKDIQVRWTRDSQLPKFMNGNVYFIVLGHTEKSSPAEFI